MVLCTNPVIILYIVKKSPVDVTVHPTDIPMAEAVSVEPDCILAVTWQRSGSPTSTRCVVPSSSLRPLEELNHSPAAAAPCLVATAADIPSSAKAATAAPSNKAMNQAPTHCSALKVCQRHHTHLLRSHDHQHPGKLPGSPGVSPPNNY